MILTILTVTGGLSLGLIGLVSLGVGLTIKKITDEE